MALGKEKLIITCIFIYIIMVKYSRFLLVDVFRLLLLRLRKKNGGEYRLKEEQRYRINHNHYRKI